jgi:hypothetical protein
MYLESPNANMLFPKNSHYTLIDIVRVQNGNIGIRKKKFEREGTALNWQAEEEQTDPMALIRIPNQNEKSDAFLKRIIEHRFEMNEWCRDLSWINPSSE